MRARPPLMAGRLARMQESRVLGLGALFVALADGHLHGNGDGGAEVEAHLVVGPTAGQQFAFRREDVAAVGFQFHAVFLEVVLAHFFPIVGVDGHCLHHAVDDADAHGYDGEDDQGKLARTDGFLRIFFFPSTNLLRIEIERYRNQIDL